MRSQQIGKTRGILMAGKDFQFFEITFFGVAIIASPSREIIPLIKLQNKDD
tara:strand:- start:294 stop:446 length:153 start_codon:yes stop_codon:yes gene_type:complete